MFLENRDHMLKSLFFQYPSLHLVHHVCSIIVHWVELCLVLGSQHFDITTSALVIIYDDGIYKNSFISDFNMLLALIKLQV